jgi:uncharacterized protein (TIGR03790 family)
MKPIPGNTSACWRILAVAVALFCAAVPEASAGGKEVVVVYNKRSPASKGVADHYADQRAVPADQVIGLDVGTDDSISRADYRQQIQEPLLKELTGRGLVEFATDIVPARNGHPGRVRYQARATKVRYILLCHGVPFRILPDPGYDPKRDDEMADSNPAHLRTDGAAVDSELALLPVLGQYPLYGPVGNRLATTTNAVLINPINGVFMVTRLDGPTPEIAKGLVDKALVAERDGLNGRAFFDLRNITNGGYATGDRWITNAATAAKRAGFETVVDNRPEILGIGFPFAQVALYAGWYDGEAKGVFELPTNEFMPGAIAYHLHSFSAQFLRNPSARWVGPLLAKGAAVTLGCIDEPYLEITPNIGVFFERLLENQFTVGEAALACQVFLSWHNVVIGDPLYRPFGKSILELEAQHLASGNPLAAWAQVRKVNSYLLAGRDAEVLRRYLEEQPGATNSAVLSEKIARMFADRGRYKQAIEWSGRSLGLPDGSPQQHSRLWRNQADWQKVLDPEGAFHSLESFAVEFPHHPDIYGVRQQQLELAKDLRRKPEIARIEKELDRYRNAAIEAGKAAEAKAKAAEAEAAAKNPPKKK